MCTNSYYNLGPFYLFILRNDRLAPDCGQEKLAGCDSAAVYVTTTLSVDLELILT